MKQVLALFLGVLIGFLGLETISSPRRGPVKPPVAAVKTGTTSTGDEATAAAAPEVPPASDPTNPASSLARARPASERPGAFFYAVPTSLWGSTVPAELRPKLFASDRTGLRNDAEFMAWFREFVRNGLEADLQPQRYLTRLDPAKFNQFIATIAEQAIEAHLTQRENGGFPWPELSEINATKLAALLSPEEMEAIAEQPFLTASGNFRASVEAFATRGLPQLTPEQLDALIAPSTQQGNDGQWYRARRFDPAAAPASLNPQQRAYLDNVKRWSSARFIVDNLHSARVRDPDVWEIWPE